MSKSSLICQGILVTFAMGVLLAFTWASHHNATRSVGTSHDSYLILLQSRRLSDPAFSHIRQSDDRPRAPVVINLISESIGKLIWGRLPSLNEHLVFMVALNFICLGLWLLLAYRLFGFLPMVLSGLFLLSYRWVVQFVAHPAVDIVTASGWALFFLVLHKLSRIPMAESRRRFLWVLLLGLVGGGLASIKFQYFFLFPYFMFWTICIQYFVRRETPWIRMRELGWASLAYVFYLEVVERLVSSGATGYWHSASLYLPYAKLLLGKAKSTEGGNFWLYAQDTYQSLGPWFMVLLAAGISWQVYSVWPKWKDYRPEWWTMGILVTSFVVIHQVISFKEPRYLLWFFAFSFILAASGLSKLFHRKPILVLSVVLLCVLWPLRRSMQTFENYLWTSVEQTEVRRAVDFLARIDSEGRTCRDVFLCDPTRFGNYMLAPQLRFHVSGSNVNFVKCPQKFESYAQIRKSMIPMGTLNQAEQTCFVTGLPESGEVVFHRPIGVGLPAELASEPGVRCEAHAGQVDCYRTLTLFSDAQVT